MSEITYTRSSTSTASAYSLERNSTNSLVQSLLGDNYREVDLTANALINIGNNALVVPSTNSSTYSTNSVTTNSTTLYEFESDEIGNITNVSGVDLNWNGRRLDSISVDGIDYISYKYNIDGQRISKTYDGVTTEYFYNGDILAGQKKGDDVIVFMYDNNGDIFGFEYNGTPYYYVKNAQNDVWLILDENGQAVVLYQYDAWGKVIGCLDASDFGLAAINPIMYRSYYVDLEMGMFMYYLNSRYYMADWGRFLSGDGLVQTGQGVLSNNMFAYCMNNPVNRIDINGNFSILGALVLAGMVAALIFIPSDVNQRPSYEAEANDNIRDDDVNIYIGGQGEPIPDKINVNINYNLKDYKGDDDYNIHIQDSYKITSIYEQERVIEIIMSSSLYDETKLNRTQSSYVKEWRAHNAAYYVLVWDREQTKDADLNNGDPYRYLYEIFVF